MDFKTFLHQHYLIFDEYEKPEACCHRCNQQIHGLAYSCETCNFWLHDSCARQELPGQISHPLHPQHNLKTFLEYYDTHYICSKCFNLCRGHRYRCQDCHFDLDLSCAFSSERNKPNDIKSKEIWHFSFDKPLVLFNYRRVAKYDYSCTWCERHVLGICYGNLESLSNNIVLFHESCLNNIPSIISKHPFHPSHPLQILESPSLPSCNACRYGISSPYVKIKIDKFSVWRRPQAYCCQKCKFQLHVGCAKLTPSLKVELHEHELTYFRLKSFSIAALPCKICNQECIAGRKETGFYRCVLCDFNYHFDCLGISSSTIHKYHRHSLELAGSFIEDDSTEYYCDICEKERKPDHHVYCCKKCKYVAHIECALNKVCLLDSQASTMKLMKKEETKRINAKFPSDDLDIEYFDHPHTLSCMEAVEQNENLVCNACGLEISGRCYSCESCKYYLHKACSILPHEVQHPLHPQHSIKLFTNLPKPFTCHECRYHSYGFVYKCYPCDFQLDVVCATTKNEDQRLTKIEKVSKLCPFDPNHETEFFIRRPNLKKNLECEVCFRSLVGSAYRCRECLWLLDESCLESLKEMQHPFHPLHTLRPKIRLFKCCSACRTVITRIGYSCEQCQIHLDLDCVRAMKLPPLNFKNHSHDLFYFGPDNRKSSYTCRCDKCRKPCWGVPFYFCLKCKIYLHLECLAIPTSVKSRCHVHRLVLKDQFFEDNSGEYYCDVCEKERYPKNHVYSCEECRGLFVAHIECVLPKMEGTEPATFGIIQS